MPQLIKDIGHSSIAVGGMSAIVATLVLSFGEESEEEELEGSVKKPVEVRESAQSGDANE